MLTAKLRWGKSTSASRKYSAITLAWLAFGWMRPGFPAEEAPAQTAPAEKRTSSWRIAPIGANWGGSIGYDIEQRSLNYGNPIMQQRFALNLRGKAITYISKPWIALVKGNVEFTTYKSKMQDYSSTNNTIFGDIGLFLVPYSRYAFEAILARTNNLFGPGFGSLVNQTTRLDLTQHYAPRDKKERYRINAYQSTTENKQADDFRLDGLTFNIDSSRLRKQSIEFTGTRENGLRLRDDSRWQYSNAELDHRYSPSGVLFVDTNGYMTSRYEQTPEITDGFRIRELTSTFYLRPPARYYLIGTARINENDYYNAIQGDSRRRLANGNLAYNYVLSQYIYFYANANANVIDSGSERRQTLTTSQSANANYPLASFNLDAYRYSSRIYTAITNITRSSRITGPSTQVDKGSTQSISLTPSHSLGRDFLLGNGRLNLGISQSLSLNEATRGNAISYFTNSATAFWQHRQGSSNTALRTSFRDSRPLNSARDSLQYFTFGGSISEAVSRYSTFTGAVDMQSTRQVSRISSTSLNNTSSNLVLNYSHLRAFGVRRLVFNSSLNAYSRAPIPVMQASPVEQGPITWENTLSYVIGRLTTEFKVYMSKQGDGSTTSFIYFSVKRYF
ncbi:MAG: hypothetical protein WA635_07210 [Gallionella sp.]